MPEKITIDKSGANTAAIVSMQADSGLPIAMRQSNYLNKLIEPDHRAIKRVTRPMLGFKSFRCARILICGIETMHMIRKGQLREIKDPASSAANPFYSLAFSIGAWLAVLLGLMALLRQNQLSLSLAASVAAAGSARVR